MVRSFLDSEDRFKIAICLTILAVDAIGFALLDLRFDWTSTRLLVATWPVLMVLAWFYAANRVDPPISHLLRETAHLALFTAVAAMLSYLAAGLNRPLVDEWLVGADQLIGFDWESYVRYVNARPWLGDLSSLFYISTLPQVAVAAIILPLLGLTERARELVMAVMLAALISIAVSGLFPSAGALAFYQPEPGFYLANNPVVDLAYKEDFFRMRAGEIAVLSIQEAKGLIAFPSYHVALSVLIVLAFRGKGLIFWPLLAVNAAVILSTPVDGGHHLIDGLAGVAVAATSLRVAAAIRRRLQRVAAHSGKGVPRSEGAFAGPGVQA